MTKFQRKNKFQMNKKRIFFSCIHFVVDCEESKNIYKFYRMIKCLDGNRNTNEIKMNKNYRILFINFSFRIDTE